MAHATVKRPYMTADGRHFETRERAVRHIFKMQEGRSGWTDYIYLSGSPRWRVYENGAIEEVGTTSHATKKTDRDIVEASSRAPGATVDIDITTTLERKFRSRQRDALTLAEWARQARGAAARWKKRSSAHAREGEFRDADDAETEAIALGRMADDLEAEVARIRTRSHATKKTEHPSGVEWSDLASTGIRVLTHSGDMPLEDVSAVEIRRDMNRRLTGYRAQAHVPVKRKKWALLVYELAQAKPWVMDQVPNDVWGLVLADVGRSGTQKRLHSTVKTMGKSYRVSARVGGGVAVDLAAVSRKSTAMKVARDFMKKTPPMSEYDSVQIVPLVRGQRDWNTESIRWLGVTTNVRRPTWVRGQGIK